MLGRGRTQEGKEKDKDSVETQESEERMRTETRGLPEKEIKNFIHMKRVECDRRNSDDEGY